MAIRAVVVDVGGVLELVDDDSWPQKWISRWERRMSVPLGHASAALARHAPSSDIATGAMSEAEMRSAYAEALGLDDDQAHQMMAEMWDSYCGELDDQMREFVASLRPAYQTAILSNSADGARREEQRRFGFEQLVDLIVYSHEVGVAKPEPRIYRLTEERLRVASHEIVFLDDLEANVDAARACGWRAVRHRSATSSIEQIQGILRAE
jgi:epoxide hydrolase-like predicted phosphatase